MPDSEDLQISWISPAKTEPVSAAGNATLGFKVVRMGQPRQAAVGKMVYISITDYTAGSSPEVSADGKSWGGGAHAMTGSNGEVWFFARSGVKAGSFEYVAGFGDFHPDTHKLSGSFKATGSIQAVFFEPTDSLKTWQNEPFVTALPIHVTTKPASQQRVEVRIVGPGSDADPNDYGARFVQGQPHLQSLESGGALPAIQAGKRLGEVQITAFVGAISSAPMRWHVLPIPDHIKNTQSATTQNMSVREFKSQLATMKYLLTGHTILGFPSGSPSVPIQGWPVRLDLGATPYASFTGTGTQPGGKVLIVNTDENGHATVPAAQLQILAGAVDQTITITAKWNAKHDGSSPDWQASPGTDGNLSVHFTT